MTLLIIPFESIKIKVQNAVTATDEIISEINTRKIEDKIVLLRVIGELENGKHSDIKFAKIEEHLQNKGAYFMLKNTHKLKIKEPEFEIDVKDTENVEEETIKVYSEENPSDLNELIPSLIMALSIEKQEGETNEVFNNRLIEDTKKVLSY